MTGPMKVDFSDVKDFDLIAAGNYQAVITDVEQRDSRSSEFPYLNWTFTINGSDFNDRKLWGITSLNPKALFSLRDLLVATGVPKEALSSGEYELDPQALIGKEIVLTVEHDTYEGKKRERIKSYGALGSAPIGTAEEIKAASAGNKSTGSGDKPKGGRRL